VVITGKREKPKVYIHALKECREKDKGGIVLVPENCTTPQTYQDFISFGS